MRWQDASTAGSRGGRIVSFMSGRTGRFFVVAGVAAWALVVMARSYPEFARLVLHPLGLTGESLLPSLGGVTGAGEAELDRIGEAVWLILRTGALVWGALTLGRQVLRVCRLTDAKHRAEALVAIAIGFGVVSYVVFVLALAGVMHSGSLTALSIALVVNAAGSTAWGLLRLRHRQPAGQRGRTNWRPVRLPLVSLAAAAIAVLFAVSALAGALALERGFDALVYHLELPRRYLEAGGFVEVGDGAGSRYPQAVELLYATTMSWGGAPAVKLLHFAFGVLVVLAAFNLARRLLAQRWAVIAAVLLISAPTVHWALTTAALELAVAFFVTLALTELIAWLDERDRRRLVRSGLLLGLALATMNVALLFVPLAVLLAALPLLGWWRRPPPAAGSARAQWAAVLGFPVVALLVAAPWYIRNALAAGDAAFPDVYALPGIEADPVGVGDEPQTLAALPWHLTVAPHFFEGSIGPLFLIAIPLLLLAFRRRPGRAAGIGVFALGFFALWAAPGSSFQARLLVPLVPALAVLGAAGLACFSTWLRTVRLRRLAAVVPWAALALAAFNLPSFVPWHGEAVVPNTLREVDLGTAFGSGPTDPLILDLTDGKGIPLQPPGEEHDAYEALRAGGYTHLTIERARLGDLPPQLAIMSRQFQGEYLRALDEDQRLELFEVLTPNDVVERVPAGFEELLVLSGLNQPTAVDFAQDGRIFVAEKGGLIKVFDGEGDDSPVTFADLRTNVNDYHERGLLGLALHPGFPDRPYVYALYTYDAAIGGAAPRWGVPGVSPDGCPDPPGADKDGCVVSGRLSQLTAAGDVMRGSERVLIEDWCQQFPSHSVGDIDFGPDGALYASAGEGANAQAIDYGQAGDPPNPCGDPPAGRGGLQELPEAEGGSLRAQDLRSPNDPVGLSGALIRIDPDTGAAFRDNPLAASEDPNARRLIAYGLRNPYRFAFRPGTSEVWIGDVGHYRWEEIDRLEEPTEAVVNFGWPCYEGTERHPDWGVFDVDVCRELYADEEAAREPYYAYRHPRPLFDGDACRTAPSVISGIAFADDRAYPSPYARGLFFADYDRGCIWVMPLGDSGDPDPNALRTFVMLAANPVDLTLGPGGDLYYVDLIGGTVRRIAYTGSVGT